MIVWLVLGLLVLAVFGVVALRGEDLSYLDAPPPPPPESPPGPEHHAVVESLRRLTLQSEGMATGFGSRGRILHLRKLMDELGTELPRESEFRPEASVGAPAGEWVLPPDPMAGRRLLYIHGGAFFAGSPLSHRPITDRLARLLGASVFALDYRLMPEHPRLAGIEDCHGAYRWLLEHGPSGPEALESLVIAGDSAGGNLTLETIAWARDEGLPPVAAAVALSPVTDSTLTAPSLRRNRATDPMLGPAFGRLMRVPSPLLWWLNWANYRMRPCDPRLSPLRGSLRDLPPVLLHASEAEMLFDDARRYVARARAHGSPAELQSWPHMVHVWHLFTPQLPQAEEAYGAIGAFFGRYLPPGAGADAGAETRAP